MFIIIINHDFRYSRIIFTTLIISSFLLRDVIFSPPHPTNTFVVTFCSQSHANFFIVFSLKLTSSVIFFFPDTENIAFPPRLFSIDRKEWKTPK